MNDQDARVVVAPSVLTKYNDLWWLEVILLIVYIHFLNNLQSFTPCVSGLKCFH